MPLSRRDFVRAGTTTALLSAIPGSRLLGSPAFSAFSAVSAVSAVSKDPVLLDEFAILAQEDEMRTLALRAVDAARAAGATYADVRLTRNVSQSFEHKDQNVVRAGVSDTESFGFGVRALVNGYWGFAASPYWEPEEATQLAQAAVNQAKTNALGTPRVVEWEPVPSATGSWVSPGIDPFSISIEEKVDFMNAWRSAVLDAYIPGHVVVPATSKMGFGRQEWFMASTEGTAISQILYTTQGEFPMAVQSRDWRTAQQTGWISQAAGSLYLQRGGWDIMVDAKVREQIPVLADAGIKLSELSAKPVDIGRYDVVFDAGATGKLLSSTLGIATQLDRAIGLEANAGGTSYLGPDPMEFLGTAQAGAPLLNVTANRSMPKGTATVKWDDEGVLPDEFQIVKDGILVDYQTTREQAPWIKTWYQKQQRPVRSHGCASAGSALSLPLQQPPNLILNPGTAPVSFESLVAGTKRGYAIMGGWTSTDFQAKNGTGGGFIREIVNGKLGDIVQGAGFLFSSMELWRNVTAIGDASSVRQMSAVNYKGQPGQAGRYSVAAVPMAVKNISIIDNRRRA